MTCLASLFFQSKNTRNVCWRKLFLRHRKPTFQHHGNIRIFHFPSRHHNSPRCPITNHQIPARQQFTEGNNPHVFSISDFNISFVFFQNPVTRFALPHPPISTTIREHEPINGNQELSVHFTSYPVHSNHWSNQEVSCYSEQRTRPTENLLPLHFTLRDNAHSPIFVQPQNATQQIVWKEIKHRMMQTLNIILICYCTM